MSRHALVLVSMLLAVLTTACSGEEPQPTMPPQPTEVVVATPTPTPTALVEPTLPAAAQGESDEAGAAFVRYFFDLVNYAQETGDIKSLRAISMQSCGVCIGGIQSIVQSVKDGRVASGGGYQIRKIRGGQSSPEGVQPAFYDYVVRVHNPRQVLSAGGGKPQEIYPASTVDFHIELMLMDGHLKVSQWERAQS